MRLKINKACDLSSISVLPPQSRRPNALPTGQQASQLRSQPSQQSFSQGLSSQHAMYSQSQLSQNSFDEVVTNEQRFSSQDREASIKRNSLFHPTSYSREDCQLPISRSSTSLAQKWQSASLPGTKCQVGEELERHIGMVENSLSKLGMILDSLHSDVLQLNKGIKQVSLDTEGIWQKMVVLDSALQSMNKGRDDIKANLDEGIKSITDQIRKDLQQEKLNGISNVLSAFEKQVEASLLSLKNDFISTLTQEMKGIVCNLKNPVQKDPPNSTLSPKGTGCLVGPQKKWQSSKDQHVPSNLRIQATAVPKEEVGGWKSVKVGKVFRTSNLVRKKDQTKEISLSQQCLMLGTEYRIIIDSDEEIERSFSCLIEEKKTGEELGNYSNEDVKEETDRILRKARRQKRKYCNPIIIS